MGTNLTASNFSQKVISGVYESGESSGNPESGEGWKIALAVGCACCSAIAAGLTLGLMTFDNMQLKILIQSGESADITDVEAKKTAKYARRIYGVRKRGNWLLTTLLVVNVSVNSAFSILMGDTTSGIAGFVISTVVLTIFGEIIPQAVCVKYGLPIGWFFVPVVVCVEWLFSPICWPLSKLLDWVLGEEIGKVYNKRQLEVLLEHHVQEAQLLRDEMNIMGGGMHLDIETAQEAMTPMDEVFCLDVESSLDFEAAMTLFSAGFSRIPVVDRTRSQCVIGLIHVKDLLVIDPSASIPIKSVHALLGRPVYTVDAHTSLLRILNDFKKGHTHLAVVRAKEEPVTSSEEGDEIQAKSEYRHIGIITLEDIIEEILQDEIHDEFERLASVKPSTIQNERIAQQERQDQVRVSFEVGESATMPVTRVQTAEQTVQKGLFHHPLAHTIPDSGMRLESSGSGIFVEELPAGGKKTVMETSSVRGCSARILVPHSTRTSRDTYLVSDRANRRETVHKRREGRVGRLRELLKEHIGHVRDSSEGVSPTRHSPESKRGADEPPLPDLGLRLLHNPPSLVSSSSNGDSSRTDATSRRQISTERLLSNLETATFNDNMRRRTARSSLAAEHEKQDLVRMGRLGLAHRGHRATSLGNPEIAAICLYLTACVRPFIDAEIVDGECLRAMVAQCRIEILPMSTELYSIGTSTKRMTLVTQGKLKAKVGVEGLETVLGPWSILASPVLGTIDKVEIESLFAEDPSSPEKSLAERIESKCFVTEYRPDYEARVVDQEARVIFISQGQYIELVAKSMMKKKQQPNIN